MTTSTKPPKAAVKPEPPAQAVSADAHWAAKMERLRARQQPTYTLRICDDDEAKARLARAERAQRLAQDAVDLEPDDPKAKTVMARADKAVDEARAAVDAATLMTLTFRGLPRPDYVALVKAHPPTEEQAEDGSDWNPDTFPAALIAAASVDGITVEDAAELMRTWANREAIALFQAAQAPQDADRTDLGKG
jgi:hypothetical protein